VVTCDDNYYLDQLFRYLQSDIIASQILLLNRLLRPPLVDFFENRSKERD
jgi:hypothetical protein